MPTTTTCAIAVWVITICLLHDADDNYAGHNYAGHNYAGHNCISFGHITIQAITVWAITICLLHNADVAVSQDVERHTLLKSNVAVGVGSRTPKVAPVR